MTAAIGYGLAISLVLIVTRLLFAVGVVPFTKFMSRFVTVADANPGWKGPLVLGWAGMRGVVSLAMGLSIPLVLNNGQTFPQRNLILFITFIVILVTLVFQGLTLPWLIRKLRLGESANVMPEQEQELVIQKKIAKTSLQYLQEKYGEERGDNKHLDNLFARLQTDLDFYQQDMQELMHTNEKAWSVYVRIYLELLDQQRDLLNKMNRRDEFDEELIRKCLALIDLEEYKIRERLPNDLQVKE